MNKIFKALSDPNRLKVLICINDNSNRCLSCLCEDCGMKPMEFQKILNITKPTISHHLEELKNAGLIICEKKGKNIYCKINHENVTVVVNFLNNLNYSNK